MKIKDMTSKTSLEVQDTDLLVIEDEEDTKSVTVAEFRQALRLTMGKDVDKQVKTTINDVIDNIIGALEKCKCPITENKYFLVSTWIESASGDIQFAILDVAANSWLTAEGITAMTLRDEDGTPTREFIIEVMAGDVWYTAQSETTAICDFNAEYSNSHEINAWMAEENAGFIRVHFDEFTQNEIAGITYDDIKVVLPSVEETEYVFETSDDSFVNKVSYVESMPEGTEPGPEEEPEE